MMLLNASTNTLLQTNDFQDELIIALIALIGVIFAAVLSFNISKKQIKHLEKRIPLEFLTEKRTEWISNIRDVTAEYWALIYKRCNAMALAMPSDKVDLSDVQKLNYLAGKLKLYLNRNSVIDNKVIGLIFEISEILNSSSGPFRDAQVKANRIMDYVGIILKVEWERVNLEVKENNLSDKEKKKRLTKKSIALLQLYKEELKAKEEPNKNLSRVMLEIEDLIYKLKTEIIN